MDNDRDMVEKAARYIFYIRYDDASLSGLVMALSALVSTIGHRIDCHRQGLVYYQDFCFLHFLSTFRVRQKSDTSQNR